MRVFSTVLDSFFVALLYSTWHGFPPIRVVHSRDLWGDHANGARPDPPQTVRLEPQRVRSPWRKRSNHKLSLPLSGERARGELRNDLHARYIASRMPSPFRLGSPPHTLSVDA